MHPCLSPALLLLPAMLSMAAATAAELEEQGEIIATLKDQRIKEASGLALSHKSPPILWTLNDSGGEPCLFAIDREGRTRAKVRVRDAANFDWEDLAKGPGQDGRPALFAADIGDNLQVRPTIQVYQIPEPELPALQDAGKEIESPRPAIWHASYPDGPHNAESLLVHPHTGRLHIITKSEDGHSTLYAFPQELKADVSMTLEKIIDIHLPPKTRMGKRPKDAAQATGASFSSDGARLVVSTYSYLHEWTIRDGETLTDALKRPAELILPPLLPQLEGVCYDADARSILLISERLPASVYRIPR